MGQVDCLRCTASRLLVEPEVRHLQALRSHYESLWFLTREGLLSRQG